MDRIRTQLLSEIFRVSSDCEIKQQILREENRLPDAVVACVGGGSNSIGAFYPFIENGEVALCGVEAGGRGLSSGSHAAPLCAGEEGVFHGMLTYILQDKDGQVKPTDSISAGLDYPGGVQSMRT